MGIRLLIDVSLVNSIPRNASKLANILEEKLSSKKEKLTKGKKRQPLLFGTECI